MRYSTELHNVMRAVDLQSDILCTKVYNLLVIVPEVLA